MVLVEGRVAPSPLVSLKFTCNNVTTVYNCASSRIAPPLFFKHEKLNGFIPNQLNYVNINFTVGQVKNYRLAQIVTYLELLLNIL